MRILKDFKIPDFKFPKFNMKELSEIGEVNVDYEKIKKAEENQKIRAINKIMKELILIQ